jgi:DNA-binding transcriptional MerR regulator
MKIPFLEGKKKEEKMKGKGYAPVNRVQQLMSRGFSETDVIDALRREGFAPEEIDSALTQALKGDVKGEPPTTYTAEKPSFTAAEGMQKSRDQPSFPPEQQAQKLPTLEEIKPSQPVVPETSLPSEYYQSYPTEDYVDYVINEKMAEVSHTMNEFAIRYNELEKRMEEIKNQLNTMVQGRSGEQQQVITKVEGVGTSLEDIQVRLSSLEKAFKETLPALIESVRALSDLVQRMKREG